MRDKSDVILIEQLTRGETGLNKIVCLLTNIHRNGYDGKQQHAEKKSDQELLEYVPVQFLHAPKIV
jgi:hypothetical protein